MYPIDGGEPVALPKLTSADEPINHTLDNHSFFIRNGERVVNIYRFDFVSGARQLVHQLQPGDPTGLEAVSIVGITPDGKYYVYGAPRMLSNLFVVEGLK